MTPKQPVLIRGRPQCAKPSATRADCERIAQAVAAEWRVTFDGVLFGRSDRDSAARRDAWRRIIDETGCSMDQLAEVWGVARTVITRGMKNERWKVAA
jgi:hypothetical protein